MLVKSRNKFLKSVKVLFFDFRTGKSIIFSTHKGVSYKNFIFAILGNGIRYKKTEREAYATPFRHFKRKEEHHARAVQNALCLLII